MNTRGCARFLSRHTYGSLLDIYSNYYSSSPSCYVPNEFFMHTSPQASVISLWVCSTPTKMSLFMLIFFFQHVYGLMTLGVAPQPSRYWTCKYLSTIICSYKTHFTFKVDFYEFIRFCFRKFGIFGKLNIIIIVARRLSYLFPVLFSFYTLCYLLTWPLPNIPMLVSASAESAE